LAQQHLDRLTGTDASFLHQETPAAHMHIGGVLVFEGPVPSLDELTNHVRSRLHRIPRYRQKLAVPPLDAGRPLWIDDTAFNISYHVRSAALPAPGTDAQLMELVARIASQPLDRAKPLWECWLVEGVAPEPGLSSEKRFALVFKTHHSLVDGVSGVDLASVLFDLAPEPVPDPAMDELEPWHPQPEPSPAELIVTGLRSAAGATTDIALRAAAAAVQPNRSMGVLRDVVEGVGEIVWAVLNPAPETPLNVEIGPHRRYAVVRQRLDDYKLVKRTLGGTVNDVLLAVVSGALARWLRARGLRTDGVEMRALVPVSVRTHDQHHTLGNRLVALRGPLPLYVDDPVARLAVVRVAMDGLKESKQAVGAATLTAMEDLAPPAVLAQASRLQFSTRLFNLLVTNIPGPQFPLYVLGRRMLDMFPLAFLPQNHALAVAIMSYDGRIEYGLLGDYDALPDIGLIADGIESSLAELVEAARSGANGRSTKRRPARGGRRAALSRSRSTAADEPAPADGPAGTDESPKPDAEPSAPDGVEANGGDPAPLLPMSRRRSTSGPAADMRAKRSRSGRSRPEKPTDRPPDGRA
jgi:WS/DGAT/MGAT family acyltransferase